MVLKSSSQMAETIHYSIQPGKRSIFSKHQKQYLNDEIELLKNSTKVLLLENSDIHNFSMMKNLCQGNIYNQLKSLLKKFITNSDKLK